MHPLGTHGTSAPGASGSQLAAVIVRGLAGTLLARLEQGSAVSWAVFAVVLEQPHQRPRVGSPAGQNQISRQGPLTSGTRRAGVILGT